MTKQHNRKMPDRRGEWQEHIYESNKFIHRFKMKLEKSKIKILAYQSFDIIAMLHRNIWFRSLIQHLLNGSNSQSAEDDYRRKHIITIDLNWLQSTDYSSQESNLWFNLVDSFLKSAVHIKFHFHKHLI